MTTTIVVTPDESGFAENKDVAKELRLSRLLPALDSGEDVVIDFSGATRATQSFVHALVGEALQKYGESILDRIEFKKCTPAVKGVIELVVDYSVGGFGAPKTLETTK